MLPLFTEALLRRMPAMKGYRPDSCRNTLQGARRGGSSTSTPNSRLRDQLRRPCGTPTPQPAQPMVPGPGGGRPSARLGPPRSARPWARARGRPRREGPIISYYRSRLRNSWGFRLGAVLNSPGEHPFALDRRLDAGSGGPAARREVEVGLFRRVADRAPGHGWVTDAHRAPKGRCRRCAGYVTRRTSWSAVSASTPNMQ